MPGQPPGQVSPPLPPRSTGLEPVPASTGEVGAVGDKLKVTQVEVGVAPLPLPSTEVSPCPSVSRPCVCPCSVDKKVLLPSLSGLSSFLRWSTARNVTDFEYRAPGLCWTRLLWGPPSQPAQFRAPGLPPPGAFCSSPMTQPECGRTGSGHVPGSLMVRKWLLGLGDCRQGSRRLA